MKRAGCEHTSRGPSDRDDSGPESYQTRKRRYDRLVNRRTALIVVLFLIGTLSFLTLIESIIPTSRSSSLANRHDRDNYLFAAVLQTILDLLRLIGLSNRSVRLLLIGVTGLSFGGIALIGIHLWHANPKRSSRRRNV